MASYSKTLDAPRLDIARCLEDAINAYQRNFFPLFFAALLWHVLSVTSFGLLAGPLTGGAVVLALHALRDDQPAVRIRDLFAGFQRFWPLLGLFLLSGLATLVAFGLFILPGLVLMTIWLYPVLFLMDRDLGIFDALRASQEAVLRGGFWAHALLLVLTLTITLGASAAAPAGTLIACLLTPVAWLSIASAYRQVQAAKPAPLVDFDAY